MEYAVYRELDGEVELVATEKTKRGIERYFNMIRKSYKKSTLLIDVRTGYFQLPMFNAEYWIAKIQ